MAKTGRLLVLAGIGFFLIASLCAAAQKEPAGLLDKKVFVGEMGKKGAAKGDSETIEFDIGRFRSRACDAYDFEDAPYQATEENGVISFTSDTTSPGGSMHWQGTVQGKELSAAALWTQTEGQPPLELWVKARLK